VENIFANFFKELSSKEEVCVLMGDLDAGEKTMILHKVKLTEILITMGFKVETMEYKRQGWPGQDPVTVAALLPACL
jgi:hypothetical protein